MGWFCMTHQYKVIAVASKVILQQIMSNYTVDVAQWGSNMTFVKTVFSLTFFLMQATFNLCLMQDKVLFRWKSYHVHSRRYDHLKLGICGAIILTSRF